MKHAVLGIGGVGGLVAGLLAKSGQQVDAIVRPQVLAAHPNHILIDQPTGPRT
jgi:ketopantoate reductase